MAVDCGLTLATGGAVDEEGVEEEEEEATECDAVDNVVGVIFGAAADLIVDEAAEVTNAAAEVLVAVAGVPSPAAVVVKAAAGVVVDAAAVEPFAVPSVTLKPICSSCCWTTDWRKDEIDPISWINVIGTCGAL